MGTALVLHPDGEIVEINFKQGGDHLALMREHIGCSLVDCVALTSRLDMWIDDEGKDTQRLNPLATALAARHGFTSQPYHGPVILSSVERNGDTIDLTLDQLRGLLATLLDVAEAI